MLRRLRPRGRRPQRRAGERGRGPVTWVALLCVPPAALLAAYIPVSALTARVQPADRPAARTGLPWLHTESGRIVDEQGRTVLLRGFNSDTLLESQNRHADLDERDAELMQQSGFDVVRLPIAWSLLEPERGSIDRGYLERIAATVDLLNAHRLYVVLSMHFLDWGPRFGGSGAPTWAALPVVPDLQWWPWESWRKHLSPAMNAATTYFWLSPDWQASLLDTWRAVATRFRDNSGVAGFDLYNEPHLLPLPPRIFELHFMWPFYQHAVEAVGAADPNHLFIVQGTFFGNVGTTVRSLQAPDLVYSSHLYTGALVPPAFDGDRGPVTDRVEGQAAEAAALPAPLWVGELGIDHRQGQAAEWADAALDAYDDLGVGWAWWQWRESPNWGVRDSSGGFIDVAYLRHLARPYLAAAPAGVHAGRGDGVSGRLRVSVDAAHGAGDVEVAWPAQTLGPPQAAGDCASGAWDAARARYVVALADGVGCSLELIPLAG